MAEGSEKPGWRTSAACCAVGGLCMLLPGPTRTSIRSVANDCLRPGQVILQPLARLGRAAVVNAVPGDNRLASHDAAAGERIRHLELRLRQQQLAQAELRRKLDALREAGAPPYPIEWSPPLLVHRLLSARVLGRERDLNGSAALLLDLGASGGAESEAFVVLGSNPVLDVGSASGIETGQPVYTGRCVLGRIERTGRWTSAVQLTTDPRYTGRAQLLRNSSEGPQFGAEGLISGRGDGTCRLTGIPYTEPVSVGDEVYTGGRTARFPAPMLYGRIVRAELEAGQRWNIVVSPQVVADSVRDVAVLRESLETVRVLGQ